MYQEPVKLNKNKKIELICLVCLAVWGVLLLANYISYTNAKGLIFSIHKTHEYDDGYVEEWVSLGYVYRSYHRNAITKEEFVPFWVLMDKPDIAPDLPTPYSGYNVPDNRSHADKYQGLLYFYDHNHKLLGTYKCINTNTNCNKVDRGHDIYDTIGNNPLNTSNSYYFDLIHENYAFVDDSYEQNASYGDPTYERIIFLYKIDEKEPKILAKFADIKESYSDDDKEKARGDNDRYIVKSAENKKWGLVYINSDGTISEVLPFEYDSISYDYDTKYYILCKDLEWFIYNLATKEELSPKTDKVIFDVWQNTNLTYYYMTGESSTISGKATYYFSVYRMNDGNGFLTNTKATAIYPGGNYVMYLDADTNRINFMDYGKEIVYYTKAHFSEMTYDKYSHPAFSINRIDKNGIGLRIYRGRTLKFDYDYDFINTVHWDYNDPPEKKK